MKLMNRMVRSPIYTDGRLLRVSREARLAALSFEAISEDTGVMKLDPDEIRAALSMFLGQDDAPPTRDDV
ncbi:MAG: hypothetical protein Q7U89_02510, partial [Coriobacteriia bacterium]|nr:hypothetical protein [Coriobacteriia bacterium]